MILYNNNEEEYFVITTMESSNFYKCHICKKTNSASNQLFLVNEYDSNQIVNTYLPLFSQLQSIKNFKYFVELFTKDSKVYVVFDYIDSPLLISKIEREHPSIEERIELLKEFYIALVKIDSLPLPIKYELLRSNNVRINSNEKIFFAYSLNLYKKSNYVTQTDLTNHISDIIKMIFQNTKIPLCVQELTKNLDKGDLNKLSSLYIAIKNLKEQYPKEIEEEKCKKEYLKNKNKKRIALVTAILLIIGIPSTYYYLVKTKTVPAMNFLEKTTSSPTIERIGTVEIKNY